MASSRFPALAAGAPSDATYLLQTANEGLGDAQAIGGLATGLMKVTTTTGAVSAVTTSAGLAGCLSDETGTGAAVFANTPTLVTPVLGAATGTSVAVSGDVKGATFHVGAAAGVDASVVIPAVGTLTISKGLVTGFA